MKICRRSLLMCLPLSATAVWLGFPLLAIASDDPISAIRRELLVATATTKVSTLGGSGSTTIQNATRFRRDRVLALAATKDMWDQQGGKLSQDDLAKIRTYIVELSGPRKSSAVLAVQDLLYDLGPDLGTSLDLLTTGSGLASVLSSFKHPYISAGLAIGSLLVPWTDEFLEKIYPTLGVIDESAIRAAVAMHDRGAFLDRNLIEEFGHVETISILFSKTNDELVEALPTALREDARNYLSHPRDKSTAFFELLSASDRRFAEVKVGIVEEIRNRENIAAAKQYWDAEARSGILLGTTFLREVLNLPTEAKAFETIGSEAYRVWQLVGGFSASPPTVGPLALTGGLVSAGLAIGTAFSGGMSSQEATSKALRQILEAIGVLRQEMHERFDRIERSQRVIIEALEDVIDRISRGQWQAMERLRTISSSLNGLRNYIESQDRQEKIDALGLEFDNVAIVRQISPNYLNTSPAMTAINTIANHAIRTSRQPAFTHSEISQWNSVVVADAIESTGRPDTAVSILALARREFGLSDAGEILNPIEWVRATNAVIEILGSELQPLPAPMTRLLETLESEGVLLKKRLDSALDQDLNIRCTEQYQLAMQAIEEGLQGHYEEVLRENSATVIYASEFPSLGAAKYSDSPAIERRIAGTANSYYTGDAVGYFSNRRQRFLELAGHVNPIDAAISVGLLRANVHSSGRTTVGSNVFRWDYVSFTFLAGKWAGAHTSHGRRQDDGVAKFTFESRPELRSYYAFLPRTRLLLRDGNESHPIGSDMPNFLEELREEVALQHARLRNAFLDSIASFFFLNPSAIEASRTYGSLLRLIFALDSWGRGATMEFASSILTDSDVTLGTPNSIQLAVKEGLKVKIASNEISEPIVNSAIASIRSAAARTASTLAPIEERPPRWYPPIEGTLFKLKALL